MVFTKKEISLKRNDEIIGKLKKLETQLPETVSLSKFIDINYRAFVNSGKTTREIYEFLKEEKVDVSSFQVFKNLYSQVKKAQKLKSESSTKTSVSEMVTVKPENPTQKVPEKGQKTQNEGESNVRKEPQPNGKVSKYNPMLPPVMLPGGVEAFIDPKTGAKRFDF